jgi:YfiH family protein
MLERRTHKNGVVYYASPKLETIGVPHGFSTRLGGISPAPFDSLNLGNPNGCEIADDYERIWENYRLLSTATGCGERALLRVHQVHGGEVVRARAGEAFDVSAKADAIVVDNPNQIASVRVADCVPVLLSSADGKMVAAVHSGWRGVVAAIVTRAVRKMTEGKPADRLIAAVGPCIGGEAFEVGLEVAEEFARTFGRQAPIQPRGNGKFTIDLRAAVKIQLIAAGIPDENIDSTDRCTYRDAGEFFSHRRERGVTGRMAAIIATAA